MAKVKEVLAVIAAIRHVCEGIETKVTASAQVMLGLEQECQKTEEFIAQWRAKCHNLDANIAIADREKVGLVTDLQKASDTIVVFIANQADLSNQITAGEQKRLELRSKQQVIANRKLELEKKKTDIEAQGTQNLQRIRELEMGKGTIPQEIQTKEMVLGDLKGRIPAMGREKLRLLDEARTLQENTPQYFFLHMKAAELEQEMKKSVEIQEEIVGLQRKLVGVTVQIETMSQQNSKLTEVWNQNAADIQLCIFDDAGIIDQIVENERQISGLQDSLQQASSTRQSWDQYSASLKMQIGEQENKIQQFKGSLAEANNAIIANAQYIDGIRNQSIQEESKIAALQRQLEEAYARMSHIAANTEAQTQVVETQQVPEIAEGYLTADAPRLNAELPSEGSLPVEDEEVSNGGYSAVDRKGKDPSSNGHNADLADESQASNTTVHGLNYTVFFKDNSPKLFNLFEPKYDDMDDDNLVPYSEEKEIMRPDEQYNDNNYDPEKDYMTKKDKKAKKEDPLREEIAEYRDHLPNKDLFDPNRSMPFVHTEFFDCGNSFMPLVGVMMFALPHHGPVINSQ